MCVPKTLVKGYTVAGIRENGERVIIRHETGNIRQCVNLPVSDRFTEISLTVTETWGENAENVHIFSFDLR